MKFQFQQKKIREKELVDFYEGFNKCGCSHYNFNHRLGVGICNGNGGVCYCKTFIKGQIEIRFFVEDLLEIYNGGLF